MRRRDMLIGGGFATAGDALALQIGRSRLSNPGGLQKPALALDEREEQILAALDDIQRTGRTYASVPTADGRWLRLLTEAADAKNVIEIGTSTGYSGIWLSLALIRTGGHLTTFEYNAGRAQTARDHFRQAGVDSLVTVVRGDAHVEIRKHLTEEAVDVVFIDADKQGYTDYLEQLSPRVRPGGLILAHNVGMAPDYIDAVTTNPELETVFFLDSGQLGVTLKKRAASSAVSTSIR